MALGELSVICLLGVSMAVGSVASKVEWEGCSAWSTACFDVVGKEGTLSAIHFMASDSLLVTTGAGRSVLRLNCSPSK